MPAANLLALIDDIASVLDDVATMTKVAAQKTSGVLGDDLALNAEQVAGVRADRELPVVWGVAKGSLINKAILIPAAIVISAWAKWLVAPFLIVGGAYLCFEGFEKLWHKITERISDKKHEPAPASTSNGFEGQSEKTKIKGAIRTDFILSAEIIIIALGTIAELPIMVQSLVLAILGVIMTAGVYGIVAAIVKMDDLGLYLISLSSSKDGFQRAALYGLGGSLLRGAPPLMRLLGIVGTIAMFLVGGGIVVHNIPFFHSLYHPDDLLWIVNVSIELGVGIVTGALVLVLVNSILKPLMKLKVIFSKK